MTAGASLSWDNLTCQVGKKYSKTCKTLLQNNSGSVRAGDILAILGPSGAGKSTLLNCLSEHNCAGYKTTGKISVNGSDLKTRPLFLSGYVEQSCEFFEKLTVYEHLIFRAKLKGIKPSDVEFRVLEVVNLLEMSDCLQTRIGSQGKGLSGGERKRLSFAAEILVQPQILFCDEPTSGLDSFLASKVLDALITINSIGTTVLCTIHQPSSILFSKLDNIYLMEGGRKIVAGRAIDVRDGFSKVMGECPGGFNLADWYLHAMKDVQYWVAQKPPHQPPHGHFIFTE